MKHKATRELFNYWNHLRGDRAAPERSDIDPAAIRNVLADTFMLDVDLRQRFPFRLAGTRVNALFDTEQKGRSFLDLWRPEERRNISAVLVTVADGACPVVAGAVAAPRGQQDCALELLFLPLRHFGRTHSRILGLVKTATQPAWLGLLPVAPLSLRSLRILDGELEEPQHQVTPILVDQARLDQANGQANAVNARSAQGRAIPGFFTDFGGAAYGNAGEPAGRRSRKPYLRVIQGGL